MNQCWGLREKYESQVALHPPASSVAVLSITIGLGTSQLGLQMFLTVASWSSSQSVSALEAINNNTTTFLNIWMWTNSNYAGELYWLWVIFCQQLMYFQIPYMFIPLVTMRSIILLKEGCFWILCLYLSERSFFHWYNFPLQTTGLLQEEDEWPFADRSSAKAARLVLLIQPLSLHHCLAEKFPLGSECGNEWNEIPWEYLTVKRMQWMKTLGFPLEM